jgi:hypothetical protein
VKAPILDRLGAFVAGLEGIDFRLPEDEVSVVQGAQFAPRLAATLDQAVEILREVEAYYQGERESRGAVMDDADTLADIGQLISWEIAGQEITDLLFVARNELRIARQDVTTALGQEDILRLASSCDSGLRTLKRTLFSVESMLFDYEGLEPPRRRWIDLEVSLQSRRLYGQLRRHILSGPRPEDRPVLEQRLREVAVRLGALRDLEIYPLLRFDDRVLFRDLRHRIEEWLGAAHRDLWSGSRLWQDIHGITELLKAINFRQELREHDRRAVRRVYQRLCEAGAPPFEAAWGPIHELAPLLGLDDELDDLLLRSEPCDTGVWRTALGRLLESLSAAPSIDR